MMDNILNLLFDEIVPQKKKDFIAVELTPSDLKVAGIKIKGGKAEIINLSVADISKLSDEDISKKLVEIASTIKFSRKPEIINVIPSNFVIFKNIEIPSVDEKEIKDIIELQAGRHTPYSREEIILGYMSLGVIHECYTRVLLIIVKKDVVTKRYDILKNAGFKAEKAVLSAECVSRFFNETCLDPLAEKPVVIVNIDRTSIDFIVEHKGDSIYTRSIPIEVGAGNVKNDLYRQKFFEGLKGSIESYQSENIDLPPDTVYFTGATNGIGELEGDIKQLMNINKVFVTEVHELLGLKKDDIHINQDDNNASVLSVIAPPIVFGDLELDLTPEDVKMRRDLKSRARDMARVGVLAMVCLVAFCSVFLVKTMFQGFYLKRINSAYVKEIQEAEFLKKVSEKTGAVENFIVKKGDGLKALTELVKAIPPEVFFNSVSYKDDRTMVFTGTADSMSRVFSLVTDLENNSNFCNVKVESTKSRRAGESEVADFGLTLALEEKK
ncbi:MAG: pilus assembly protein PilM [Candidatus Omnitrophica bacterium]|nr:pilus assembly protein PilM [Candidatus Omnitrophota bacterium]